MLETHISEVLDILKKYMPTKCGAQDTVIEAMSYSVEAGGKRLRPIIMLETYRMFSDKPDDISIVEPFAAALEMIHTYSLVHDDLPAMDNDTLRRGKPTTWAVYGDAMAVLTGDALLNYSQETALKAFDSVMEKFALDEITPDDMNELTMRIIKALKVLTNKAGIYGMLGGQVADVEAEEKGISMDERLISYIHENKTGALLQSAFAIGAILGGANDDEVESILKAALEIGVAFQIQDDILDVIGDEKELGKPIGSDEKNEKTTYVTLFGMDAAKQQVKEMTESALGILQSFEGHESPFLAELVEKLIDRNY